MAAPDDEMLFAALAVLRAAAPEDRAERPLATAWLSVMAWLEHRLPGADKADLRQDALVKVLRHLDACQAKNAPSAAAWLMTIAKRTAIDGIRSGRRSPIDRGLRDHTDEHDPLDGLAAPDREDIDPGAADEIAAEIEEALDRALVSLHASPAARIGPRAYARARLYRRLFGLSIDETRARLAWHAPLKDELVSKWIERGQVPLDAALRLWIADDPDGRGVVGERIRARVAERRLDAGRPRPDRRTRPDGSGRRLSVRRGAARLLGCRSRMYGRGSMGTARSRRGRR